MYARLTPTFPARAAWLSFLRSLELAVASHQSLIEILKTIDGIWMTKRGRLPIPLHCLLAIL